MFISDHDMTGSNTYEWFLCTHAFTEQKMNDNLNIYIYIYTWTLHYKKQTHMHIKQEVKYYNYINILTEQLQRLIIIKN